MNVQKVIRVQTPLRNPMNICKIRLVHQSFRCNKKTCRQLTVTSNNQYQDWVLAILFLNSRAGGLSCLLKKKPDCCSVLLSRWELKRQFLSKEKLDTFCRAPENNIKLVRYRLVKEPCSCATSLTLELNTHYRKASLLRIGKGFLSVHSQGVKFAPGMAQW